MKFFIKPLAGLVPLLLCLRLSAAPAPATTGTNEVRQELVQAILSTGTERQTQLGNLADSGSKLANDVLSAWTMEEVYLYVAPDGSKVPVLLEDQQDARRQKNLETRKKRREKQQRI